MSYGRRKIFTDEAEITAENVVREVNAAYLVHNDNRNEIISLYQYYRNKTAIEDKKKEVRENINFKVGEARCLEVTNFYKGYIFGEPIQYVRREKSQNGTADDVIAADINALNSHMADASKAFCDSKLGKWMLVAGTGYKMVLPNQAWQKDGDEPPFNVYAPDPRRTFVVYSSDVDEHPVMNVTYSKQKTGDTVFTVYTQHSSLRRQSLFTRLFSFLRAIKPVIAKNFGDAIMLTYTNEENGRGVFHIQPLVNEWLYMECL